MARMNRELIEWLPMGAVGDLLMNGVVSLNELSPEQYSYWSAWEPPPVPVTTFWLGGEDQRREFLWECSWQGEPVFFAAVAHIWNSLEGNRAAHCIKVGQLSGTGGEGKGALLLTLKQFLRESLAFNPSLPRLDDFPDMESWNAACHRHWHDDEAHVRRVCARYSAILDGRVFHPEETDKNRSGQVIAGPWRSDRRSKS